MSEQGCILIGASLQSIPVPGLTPRGGRYAGSRRIYGGSPGAFERTMTSQLLES